MYIVDPQSGFCSCFVGKFGKFCKHQADVSKFYGDVICNNLPPITPQAKYEMAVLAFGPKAGDKSIYQSLQSSNAQNTIQEVHEDLARAVEQPTSISVIHEHPDEDVKNAEKWIKMSINLFQKKFSQYGCSEKVI